MITRNDCMASIVLYRRLASGARCFVPVGRPCHAQLAAYANAWALRGKCAQKRARPVEFKASNLRRLIEHFGRHFIKNVPVSMDFG